MNGLHEINNANRCATELAYAARIINARHPGAPREDTTPRAKPLLSYRVSVIGDTVSVLPLSARALVFAADVLAGAKHNGPYLTLLGQDGLAQVQTLLAAADVVNKEGPVGAVT